MSTHTSVAAKVRAEKEKHPERFCRHPECLWRTSSKPCLKHLGQGNDFVTFFNGSLVLVRPLTQAAKQHLLDHLDSEAQWFGDCVCVEPRYLDSLVSALRAEGFVVR